MTSIELITDQKGLLYRIVYSGKIKYILVSYTMVSSGIPWNITQATSHKFLCI